jgi:hypothetical protein
MTQFPSKMTQSWPISTQLSKSDGVSRQEV